MDVSQSRDVLVVEDNPEVCQEMADYLRRSGLTVLTAGHGIEALPLARRHTPKVVILDYNLPYTDGATLAGRFREFLPNAAIIMMSGRIEGVSEKTLEALRITVFLNKPVPMALLRKAVLRLVAQYDVNPGPPMQVCWLASGWGGVRA